ncbi:MAG: hypothetical protein SF029_09820 [bacterium]|nr:hypothetical protein [bacterium]
MRRFLLWGLMALCLGWMALPAQVQVQAQDADIWYWAFDPDDGRLVAYTLEGQVNTILEGATDIYLFRAARIAPDQAIAFVFFNGMWEPLRLNSDSTERLAEFTPTAEDPTLYLFDQRGDWLVYVNPTPVAVGGVLIRSVLLVNGSTGAVVPLERVMQEGYVFSEDGTFLRYVIARSDDEENPQWELVERDLTSGAERVAASLPSWMAFASHSSNGDHWLYLDSGTQTGVRRIILQSITGEERVLTEIDRDAMSADTAIMNYRFVDDLLLEYDFNCRENCSYRLMSPQGEELVRYTVDFPALDVRAAWLVNAGGGFLTPSEPELVMMIGEALFLVKPNAAPVFLGNYDPQHVTGINSLLSPDRRYLLTVSNTEAAQGYRLWDLATEDVVFENSPERFFQVFARYQQGGVLISESALDFWVYLDGEVIDLPGVEELDGRSRNYLEILPDGRVLAYEREQSNVQLGYYDLATGEFVSLVEGALPLVLENPLRP